MPLNKFTIDNQTLLLEFILFDKYGEPLKIPLNNQFIQANFIVDPSQFNDIYSFAVK